MKFLILRGIIPVILAIIFSYFALFNGANSQISGNSENFINEIGTFDFSKNLLQDSSDKNFLIKKNLTDLFLYYKGSQNPEFIKEDNFQKIEIKNTDVGLFQISSIHDKYVFGNDKIQINLEKPGIFYVDFSRENGSFIYNLNSTLKITLKETKTGDVDFYLYPGMFVNLFNGVSESLQNPDFLRISSLYLIGYNSKTENTENFLGTGKSEFFSESINFINEYNKSLYLENSIYTQTIDDENFGILDFLLINPEKKGQRELSKILTKLKNGSSVEEISSSLKTLESHNENYYNKFLESLQRDYYYDIYFGENKQKIILASQILSQIFGGAYPKDTIEELEFRKKYYTLFFSKNDLGNDSILNYSNFITRNISSIDKMKFESYNYFLNKVITNEVSSNKSLDEKFQGITKLLKSYNDLNREYFLGKANAEKVTAVYGVSDMTQSLLSFFHKELFLPDRNEDGLLVLNSGLEYSREIIIDFEAELNKTFNIFNISDRELLVSNHARLFVIYDRRKTEFTEMFIALRDYGSYVLEYKNFGSSSRFGYDQELFRRFIENFEGGFLDNYKISETQNGIEVSGLIFNGESISFYAEIGEKIKITNIKIGDKQNSEIFNLTLADEIDKNDPKFEEYKKFFINLISAEVRNIPGFVEFEEGTKDEFLLKFAEYQLFPSGEYSNRKVAIFDIFEGIIYKIGDKNATLSGSYNSLQNVILNPKININSGILNYNLFFSQISLENISEIGEKFVEKQKNIEKAITKLVYETGTESKNIEIIFNLETENISFKLPFRGKNIQFDLQDESIRLFSYDGNMIGIQPQEIDYLSEYIKNL